MAGNPTDKELLRAYHEKGDLAAREQLIERVHVARALARAAVLYRGEQLDDLVQIGAIGLIKAIDRFDIERGVELTTYATPNIIGEIKRHFRDRGWAVRVPRGLQELNVQLLAAVEQLTRAARALADDRRARQGGRRRGGEVLEALESGRAYSSLSLSAGSRRRRRGDRPARVDRHRGARSTSSRRTAPCSRRAPRARRARAADPPPALLRGLTQSQIAAAGRHLADARLAADPAVAREDPRRDRRRGGDRRTPRAPPSEPGLTACALRCSHLLAAAATRRASDAAVTGWTTRPHLQSTRCGRPPSCARASSPSSRRRAICAARRAR